MTLDLCKPNTFKILGLRSIIYVAMATIGILRNLLANFVHVLAKFELYTGNES